MNPLCKYFFIVCLPLELLPVSRPLTWWCTSTLGAAMLCSFWAGSWFGAYIQTWGWGLCQLSSSSQGLLVVGFIHEYTGRNTVYICIPFLYRDLNLGPWPRLDFRFWFSRPLDYGPRIRFCSALFITCPSCDYASSYFDSILFFKFLSLFIAGFYPDTPIPPPPLLLLARLFRDKNYVSNGRFGQKLSEYPKV